MKYTFDSFWTAIEERSPLTLPKGQIVTADEKRLIVIYGTGKEQFCRSRKKAQEDFSLCSGGGRSKSGYFNSVYDAVIGVVSAKLEVPTDAVAGEACYCLCDLSRRFLTALEKRHIHLKSAGAYPTQWINWCIQGAQIKPYRKNDQRLPIASVMHAYLERCAVVHDYRSIWRQAVADLMRIGMTLGQAQKLVNLLSKYCFAYYFSEIDRGWMAENAWVREFARDFDIPIDQVVLRNIRRSYKQNDVAGGIYFTDSSKKDAPAGLNCRHVTSHAKVSWNRLTCFGCYAEIQEFVRWASQGQGCIFPIEFEMQYLWP